ncbi:MAG: anti-sigma B factor antagonist [Paraglaciecola sp.]|jgi:anti-sigma B factor antagonist
MPLKIVHDIKVNGLCKVTIDDDMTIYSIKELKDGLSEIIDIFQEIDLDLSAVKEIDTTGIQLLLALKRELISKDKKLKISSASAVIIKLMEDYSVNNILNKEDNI